MSRLCFYLKKQYITISKQAYIWLGSSWDKSKIEMMSGRARSRIMGLPVGPAVSYRESIKSSTQMLL